METTILCLVYCFLFSITLNNWSFSSMIISGLLGLLYFHHIRPNSFAVTNLKEERSPLIVTKEKKILTIEEIFSLSQQDVFLHRCLQIINNQLQNEEFDVPTLAKELCMARVTLYREIKKRTGRTAITFIKLARLMEAHKFLKDTNYSIADIAYQVGFKAPSHFSTSYKKEYKCTPNKMRLKLLS